MSGASLNLARSLGPALVSGDLATIWIYLLEPALGALLGVLISGALQGPPTPHEADAARGQPRPVTRRSPPTRGQRGRALVARLAGGRCRRDPPASRPR